MLKWWRPEYKINVDKEFKENRSLYNKKITYFTEKYANPNNIRTIYDQNWDFSYNYNNK